MLIGGMSLVHEQHGTSDAAPRRHPVFGTTMIIAGLLRTAEVLAGGSALAIPWSLAPWPRRSNS